MPGTMCPYNSTGGSAHCRTTPASDRAADDGTAHRAAAGGGLGHDIRYRKGKSQHQENGQG
jgi:hypothetical protein